MTLPPYAALLVIDLQCAIDSPVWASAGGRNHPGAEKAALRLLEVWRSRHLPVVHVRHDSVEPQSTYRPGQAGHAFKPGFAPRPGELLTAKHTGSAFTNTELHRLLQEAGVESLVVCGVITNNSVETTVRHGATLGWRIWLVEDACFTFARKDLRGRIWSAEDVHALSLANLDGEYCTITTVDQLCSASPSAP